MSHPHNWARSALGSVASSTATVLIGLGTGILVARFLGPEGRGILANIVTWTTMLAALTQLPMAEAIVSSSASHPKIQVVRTAFRLSMVVLCVTALPCILLLFWLLSDFAELTPALIAAYALTYFVAQSLGQVYRGHFQIERQFAAIQMYTVLQPLLYLVFLVALFAAPLAFDVATVLILLTASMIVTGAVRVLVSGSPFWGPPGPKPAGQDHSWTRLIGRAALMFHLPKVAQKLGGQGDRLLLVMLVSAFEAGLFFVALTFAAVLPGMLGTAVRLLALPALVSLEGEEKSRAALKLVSVAWIMGLAGLVTTAVLAPVFVPLLFGAAFQGAVPLAMGLGAVLALRSVRVAMTEVLKSYMVSLRLSSAPLLMFVVLAGLSLVLFPLFGVYGIIAAQVGAEAATMIFLAWQIKGFAPAVASGGWVIPRRKDIAQIAQVFTRALVKKLR
jgi:antigen flippase